MEEGEEEGAGESEMEGVGVGEGVGVEEGVGVGVSEGEAPFRSEGVEEGEEVGVGESEMEGVGVGVGTSVDEGGASEGEAPLGLVGVGVPVGELGAVALAVGVREPEVLAAEGGRGAPQESARMRLLYSSPMYTVPEGPTATPKGLLNKEAVPRPSAKPPVGPGGLPPAMVVTSPRGDTMRMRWLV